MNEIRKYGWIPDHPDHRDLKFSFSEEELQMELPKSVDLTDKMPSVFDQKKLSSCTSNAICAALEFCEMKKDSNYKDTLSRLFHYYNERDEQGDTNYDSGSSLRTGIKVANRLGICLEKDWTYDVSKYKDKPNQEAYDNALHQKAIDYQSLNNNLDSLKRCLALGLPFVGGISLFESFESKSVAKTGIVPDPSDKESFLGGHAVCWVAFFEDKKQFKVRNSWGEGWGDHGNFYLSYNYVESLADDLWVIQTC